MTYANRRAAAQMERDGIRKLSAWGKPQQEGCATIRRHIGLPCCGHQGCGKKAGYSTPIGNRCSTHAREASLARTNGGQSNG